MIQLSLTVHMTLLAVKSMMYGFGDAEEPFHETVELVEVGHW